MANLVALVLALTLALALTSVLNLVLAVVLVLALAPASVLVHQRGFDLLLLHAQPFVPLSQKIRPSESECICSS